MSHEYNIEAVNNGFIFRDYNNTDRYDAVRSVYTSWDQVVTRIANNPLEYTIPPSKEVAPTSI